MMLANIVEAKAKLMCKLFMSIHAEEQPPQSEDTTSKPPSSNPEPLNFEALIARARKEEKDKLYPRITQLETEVKEYIKRNNELLVASETAKAEVDAMKAKLVASGKDDSVELAKLKKDLADLTAQYTELQKTIPNAEAIEAKYKAIYEVKLYREAKLREAGTTIIPELVSGETKEEIDASIEKAKARYAEIFASNYGGAKTPPVPAAPTSAGIVNKQLKIEDIQNLDPKSKEYAEFRKQMGLR